MHILIGIGAALALLYFWLAGNWFARLIMFLPLAFAGYCANVWVLDWLRGGHLSNAELIFAGVLGLVWGFGLTNLPRYCAVYRYRTQVLGISHKAATADFFDIWS